MKYFDQGGVSAGAPADASEDAGGKPLSAMNEGELRSVFASLGLGDLLSRQEDSYSRVSPQYQASGSSKSVRQGSPFVPMGELDPPNRPPGSVMNTPMPYQPPGYTNYRIDPRTPRPFDYQSGFQDLGREAYSPYHSGTVLAQSYLQNRMDVPTSLTQQFARNLTAYRPYTSTLSSQYAPQYTGYNPFSQGVNPYAARMSQFMPQAQNPFMYAQPAMQPMPMNPFVYRSLPPAQPISRPARTVFQGSTTPMKKGGQVDLGIAAVPLRK